MPVIQSIQAKAPSQQAIGHQEENVHDAIENISGEMKYKASYIAGVEEKKNAYKGKDSSSLTLVDYIKKKVLISLSSEIQRSRKIDLKAIEQKLMHRKNGYN